MFRNHPYLNRWTVSFFQISCKVDSYFLTSQGRKSPGIASKGYWMGIKVIPERVLNIVVGL